MSGLPAPSALTNVWPRLPGSPGTASLTSGPVPLGGINTGTIPTVNNSNFGNLPPPIPQVPSAPFPAVRQPFGGANSINLNNYALPQNFPALNPNRLNTVPNPAQAIQNEANNRRLLQLEGENTQRRNATSTLQQVGTHLLQDQMSVQEQVLQYQFMLEQCLETLDHQNLVLNGQAEEVALLRAKLRTFDSFMDTLKHSRSNNQLGRSNSIETNFLDNNALCSRNLLKSLSASPGSPFSPGGFTRATSSKFQPFNPRYRSPTNRSMNLNQSRSATPSNPNPTTTNGRLSRPATNFRN